MEQKTEASQAVDERQLFEGWCGAGRYRFVTLKRMSGERYVHPGVQADWEVWQARAALKAQPAPTEATAEPVMWFEAEASAKGQPLRHVIGSMLYSTRMHTTKPEVLNNALWPLYEHPAPTEAAQGEDSARLECAHANGRTASWDWITCDDCGAIYTGSGEREWGIAQNMWFKNVAEAKFYKDNGRYPDRARASAKTGGVKPMGRAELAALMLKANPGDTA